MYNWRKYEAKRKIFEVRQTRKSEDQDTVKNGKKANQKPHNKHLINLVSSVCTGRYLASVFFIFLQTSIRTHLGCKKTSAVVNTFPYGLQSRVISPVYHDILFYHDIHHLQGSGNDQAPGMSKKMGRNRPSIRN